MGKKKYVPVRTAAAQSQMRAVYSRLPSDLSQGIGNVIVAHALLEWKVVTLVCDLLKIDYSDGRVVFAYLGASRGFLMARELLEMKEVTVTVDLSKLQTDIDLAGAKRNELAHGLWMDEDGEPRLRLIKGEYQSPDGPVKRTTLPQGGRVPAGYFDALAAAMTALAGQLDAIGKEAREQLRL